MGCPQDINHGTNTRKSLAKTNRSENDEELGFIITLPILRRVNLMILSSKELKESRLEALVIREDLIQIYRLDALL